MPFHHKWSTWAVEPLYVHVQRPHTKWPWKMPLTTVCQFSSLHTMLLYNKCTYLAAGETESSSVFRGLCRHDFLYLLLNSELQAVIASNSALTTIRRSITEAAIMLSNGSLLSYAVIDWWVHKLPLCQTTPIVTVLQSFGICSTLSWKVKTSSPSAILHTHSNSNCHQRAKFVYRHIGKWILVRIQ